MKLSYAASVYVDGDVKVSAVCDREETMQGALSLGVRDATTYLAMYPRAKVEVLVTGACGSCYGHGTLMAKNGKHTKRCVDCKGKGGAITPVLFPLLRGRKVVLRMIPEFYTGAKIAAVDEWLEDTEEGYVDLSERRLGFRESNVSTGGEGQ